MIIFCIQDVLFAAFVALDHFNITIYISWIKIVIKRRSPISIALTMTLRRAAATAAYFPIAGVNIMK